MKWHDYSNASVQVEIDDNSLVGRAPEVLRQEIFRRTGLNLEGGAKPIRLSIDGTLPPEGYRLTVTGEEALVEGADTRGLLYGAGKLLRGMRWGEGELFLPEGSSQSAPESAIRGHQLGYRPKTNAYDAWSPEQYDQYIRELALFGANSIELMPPHTDDEPTSRHMRWDALDMLCGVSEIIHSYGLAVWLWYPILGEGCAEEQIGAMETGEWQEVFSAIPHLDHIFIPGGDPGEQAPPELFAWGKRMIGCVHSYHPGAKLWISPQTGTPSAEWMEAFYSELERLPTWLEGVVFAPWERDTLRQLRARTPGRYPIRHYPDISHTFRCQYPIPKWDLPMALTLGRECINPRPLDEKRIHNLHSGEVAGSVSYSEGINDDVNKFIWSAQDWDSGTEALETLREYAGLFIDWAQADDIAQGLLALERNLRGSLAQNTGVDTCLGQWREMERRLCPFGRDNLPL
ncbi:MAG: glycoside hydrolase family 20 zincin-like fold domain-containing protein [Oscillospiraceae bacterium]